MVTPVLAALKKKKAITYEKYYDALVKLCMSEIHYINLDGRLLFEAAKTLDWKVDDYFKRATDRLRGPYAEIVTSIDVAAVFLLLLAKENKDARTEELLIIFLLESITEGRDFIGTLAFLRYRIKLRFVLLPYGKTRVLRIIKIWEKAQILKSRGLILPFAYHSEFLPGTVQ